MYIVYVLVLLYLAMAKGQLMPCSGQEEIKFYNPSDIQDPCWLHNKDIENVIPYLETIEEKIYHSSRAEANASNPDFGDVLSRVMVEERGLDIREFFNFGGTPELIPSGISLDGYTLVKDGYKIQFYYNVYLKNSTTHFTLRHIKHDFQNLILHIDLFMKYIRISGDSDWLLSNDSQLYYRPTISKNLLAEGNNVEYVSEARMRFINQDTLQIEHIISALAGVFTTGYDKGVLYGVTPFYYTFIMSLQNKLDCWLKDYLNSYMQRSDMKLNFKNSNMFKFDNQKRQYLNMQVDKAIEVFKKRLSNLQLSPIRIPNWQIYDNEGLTMYLGEGRVIGLDSMHRRSVATSSAPGEARHITVDVGFNIKAIYKYKILPGYELPSLNGEIMLSSPDVRAQMHLGYMKNEGFVEMYLTSIQVTENEDLSINGPARMYLSYMKHLYEHEVMTLMKTAIIHSIRSLNNLADCNPDIANYNSASATDTGFCQKEE